MKTIDRTIAMLCDTVDCLEAENADLRKQLKYWQQRCNAQHRAEELHHKRMLAGTFSALMGGSAEETQAMMDSVSEA